MFRFRRIVILTALAAMTASVGGAQVRNAIRIPVQVLPSQIGWVGDEFIVAFKPNSARQLTVTNRGGRPEVNIQTVQNRIDQFGVAGFRRQFPIGASRRVGADASRLDSYYKVKLQSGVNLEAALSAFAADPNVDHVEKIGIHPLYTTPNDPYFENPADPTFPYNQWHYWNDHGLDADSAWDAEAGDESVVIGILDTGVRYFHVDIGGNSPPWGPDNPYAGGNVFINSSEIPANGVDDDGNGYVDDVIGWDFVSDAGGFGVRCIDEDCGGVDNDPDDGDGHGTHVSGTVAAITNNNILVSGIAGGYGDGSTSSVGNGVKILPLRIGYHAKYQGFTTGIVRMDWAAEAMAYIASLVDAGVNVTAINCSWGSSNSGGIDAAVNNLLAHDVMIVHAAGNSGSNSADYLGGKAGVMNVAATDKNGDGASFSNYGSWVDVAAPGVEILSTYRNPDDTDRTAHYIAVLDGTSMSTPHVCGIAALLESCNSSLTGPQKFDLIVNNTSPYTDTRDLGSGIANAKKALDAAGCASGCAEQTPMAEFNGTPMAGDAPLTVDFTDLSTNNPDSWLWDFGDGDTSNVANPVHEYAAAGTYTVTLISGNCAGSDVQTKPDYVSVTDSTCYCPFQSDYNNDGIIDNVDLNWIISQLFSNADAVQDPNCVADRMDFNCDGVVDNLDLNLMLAFLFQNGSGACNPCDCASYPNDCP